MISLPQALALTPLYLTSVGGVLNSDGNSLYSYYTATNPRDFQDYMWVEFGGALGSLILCVSISNVSSLFNDMCMWFGHFLFHLVADFGDVELLFLLPVFSTEDKIKSRLQQAQLVEDALLNYY